MNITVNDLNNYLICPHILKFQDRNNYWRWSTFDIDINQYITDLPRYIAILTYRILLDILSNCEYEVTIKRPEKSLQYYESEFNESIWKYFEINNENIKTTANGWIRLFEIYKKIIELSNSYDYLAENITFSKRIFRNNPISVKSEIPVIFANTKSACCDLLLILPLNAVQTKGISLYNSLVLDYIKEVKLKINTVHIINIDELKVVKTFDYKSTVISNLFDISNIENGKAANLALCQNCIYGSRCGNEKTKGIYL